MSIQPVYIKSAIVNNELHSTIQRNQQKKTASHQAMDELSHNVVDFIEHSLMKLIKITRDISDS